MNLEITSLRNLIAALDDAQRLQDGLSGDTTQPYLQELFKRLARAHDRAARDFVAWVFQAGGSAPRGCSPFGAFRAKDAAWKVRVSLDPEMVRMTLAEKSEARVLRRFRAAATRLHDADLCDQVEMHQREIEHVFMQLNSFGYVMRARRGAPALRSRDQWMVGLAQRKTNSQGMSKRLQQSSPSPDFAGGCGHPGPAPRLD